MHPSVRYLPFALLFVAAVAGARPPEPEPDNLLNDRFGLQASIGYASSSTRVRFDADDGRLGTELDLEDDLAIPKNKIVGRGEVWFRMRERHRARLSSYYLPLDRRATTQLTRTINFGNDTFVANELVDSQLEFRLLALSYSYSFLKNERFEAAASIGFDVVGFEAKATVPARLRTVREDRSGPAPLGGLEGTARISSRWYAEGRFQYLSVKIDEVEGSLQAWELNGLYRLNRNVTFGLGYSTFRIEIDSLDPGDSGVFDLKTGGPQLFARVGF